MIDKSTISILAVDDEPFMLKLLARTLTNLGYTSVTVCEGALRALEVIDSAAAPPDLVLMDLNMPEMDGVEFVRSLVKRDYRGSLILVSGEDARVLQAAEKLVQAHQLTVLGHLRKPVQPDTLAAFLVKWKPAAQRETVPARKVYGAKEVQAAIAGGELVNYYQPKIALPTGRVAGLETLVRWRHPVDGLVFPDQFVGMAETHGLIGELTRMVVAAALRDAKSWQQTRGQAVPVAINVSMDDLNSLDFADYIANAAEAAGVPATDVTLEVTESQLMQDLRIPLEVLTRLRLKRFCISIDDFGTGHSSLAQLRDMPFDELKIDRGFVHRAWADETVNAIFNASAVLARKLGMQIVAEGVEDRADWDHVLRARCDFAQGYYIAEPMPVEDLYRWIADWERRAAP